MLRSNAVKATQGALLQHLFKVNERTVSNLVSYESIVICYSPLKDGYMFINSSLKVTEVGL